MRLCVGCGKAWPDKTSMRNRLDGGGDITGKIDGPYCPEQCEPAPTAPSTKSNRALDAKEEK